MATLDALTPGPSPAGRERGVTVPVRGSQGVRGSATLT